jgi:hypothetical protein
LLELAPNISKWPMRALTTTLHGSLVLYIIFMQITRWPYSWHFRSS